MQKEEDVGKSDRCFIPFLDSQRQTQKKQENWGANISQSSDILNMAGSFSFDDRLPLVCSPFRFASSSYGSSKPAQECSGRISIRVPFLSWQSRDTLVLATGQVLRSKAQLDQVEK